MKTIEMKKEWTNEDHKRANKAIYRLFKRLYNNYLAGEIFRSFKELDNIIGIAYVSSGMYAILGICNGVNVFYDAGEKLRIEMFCIDLNGNIYAELWDENENEYYILIG